VATGLERIDWSAPWLSPLRTRGQAVCAEVLALERGEPPTDSTEPRPDTGRVPTGACVATALNHARERWQAQATSTAAQGLAGHPLEQGGSNACPPRFVSQAVLAPGMAYEWHIHLHQSVPTRDGVHDFFNGLIWLHWPRTKQRLHQWQALALAATGGRVQAERGLLRDQLTLFDENGAVLQAPDALWQALQNQAWDLLFGPLRPLWAQARLTLFGHALLEKLMQPRAPIVAHVLRVQHPLDADPLALDGWLARHLSIDQLMARPLAPLPVLGVPGWWAANASPAFYADTRVFRPPRPRPVTG
jgi:Protein of unknown function (DUF3025)